MVASTSTLLNRDEFLTIGTHCSEASCHQLDFLPFKCPSCSLPFCSDHWRPPTGHNCPKFDPRAYDNIIPSCPICSHPIPHPSTTTPDEAVSDHLESGQCSGLLTSSESGRRTPPKTNTMCHERRCRTKMVVPIKCDQCGDSFCAQHRWATDHACRGMSTTVRQLGGKSSTTSGVGRGGLQALRRAQEALAAATAPSKLKGTSTLTTTATRSNPVGSESERSAGSNQPTTKLLNTLGVPSKSDQRAKAEQQSAMKGLEARAKKGLLSEDEKLKYATIKAMQAKGNGGGKKEGCRIS